LRIASAQPLGRLGNDDAAQHGDPLRPPILYFAFSISEEHKLFNYMMSNQSCLFQESQWTVSNALLNY
jgi:hypothetical protein